MANVGAVISSIRNIMRQDRGISGDAQRLEQLGWMLFLKIIDDKDQELEITKDDYVSVIPEELQWRSWATDTEGITGDELLEFIDSNAQDNKGLFATLRELTSVTNPKRAAIVKEVFEGSNNFMKSGYEMRKVINKLNEVDFNNSEDKHIFGDIYESILVELRDAGNKGEYYTPRAVTQLMTQMIDPKLGEKVLDPAAGTGGFLTAAIDHVRENYVHTVEDEHQLQKSITGWEFKPVAYVLGLTNLILHEMDIPDYHYMDSLKKEYNSIGAKDRVDVILANPPFGASIADGVETNFPATYRCKESADLFVILMLQLLKPKGRWAIVLPDGSITGDGVKARIREKLLTDCNLHTIIRLPQSTFFPAMVHTNLLFFEKGSKTTDIWYYEHKLPEGQKSYSKTKPIQFNEFDPIIDWWNNRKESDVSWKVNIRDIENWDLDVKNPIQKKIEFGNPKENLESFRVHENNFENALTEIVSDLGFLKNSVLNEIVSNHKYLFKHPIVVSQLKQAILQEAIRGKLTTDWRIENSDFEPASELYKLIKKKKEILIKDRIIAKSKKLTPFTEDEIPFDIPKSWTWCKLGEIVELVMGQSPPGDTYNKSGVGMPFFQGKKEFGEIFPKSNSTWCSEPKRISKPNDVLISVRAPVGDVNLSDKHYAIGRGLSIIRSFADNELNYWYLFYLLRAEQNNWKQKGSFFDAINRDVIENKLIPLPPRNEQREIVVKVETLMRKCDGLEQEIKTSETNAQMLMQAVLKEAFEGKQEVVEV